MAKNTWTTPLPQPITIPEVMTLKTLADVHKLFGHIPTARRRLSTWQYVETQLNAAAEGGDVRDVSVSLMLALQIEGVQYRVS